MARSSFTDPVVILGMHRSGTSMLTRVCNLLGLELGDDLIPPRQDNEKGFFESKPITDHNEFLFTLFGSNSQGVIPFPDNWTAQKEVKATKKRILAFLKKGFKDKPFWGFKDPRICRLMPLWLEVFSTLKVTPKYLICFRHPHEVVTSLAKRKNLGGEEIDYEHGMLFWLQHNLDLEYYSRDSRRGFIHFPDLYHDVEGCVTTASKRAGIIWPKGFKDIKKELSGYISPSLRHHVSKQQETLPDLVDTVYSVFLTAAKTGRVNTGALDKVREQVAMLTRPSLRYYERQNAAIRILEKGVVSAQNAKEHAQNRLTAKERHIEELETALEQITQSISWRMLAPVRGVLGLFRRDD